jgi:hypothetical protein
MAPGVQRCQVRPSTETQPAGVTFTYHPLAPAVVEAGRRTASVLNTRDIYANLRDMEANTPGALRVRFLQRLVPNAETVS